MYGTHHKLETVKTCNEPCAQQSLSAKRRMFFLLLFFKRNGKVQLSVSHITAAHQGSAYTTWLQFTLIYMTNITSENHHHHPKPFFFFYNTKCEIHFLI